MKTLPLLAALLCSATMAGAAPDLDLLQSQVATLESRVAELEQENTQLRSRVTSASASIATQSSSPAVSKGSSSTRHATVRAGDTLAKVAKRHGTSTKTLVKLNAIKNPSMIHPGQKLRLPDRAPVASSAKKPQAQVKSKPAAAPVEARGVSGTHIVKSGESFYSISRQYGLSQATLQAANPAIKPERLRAGQILKLGGASIASRPAPAAAPKRTIAAAPKKATAPVAKKQPAAAAAPAKEEAPKETAAPSKSSSGPRLRLVVVDQPLDFGAFAVAHGTTTAKLNALNGHSLNAGTVLATGSEFYVPAQP